MAQEADSLYRETTGIILDTVIRLHLNFAPIWTWVSGKHAACLFSGAGVLWADALVLCSPWEWILDPESVERHNSTANLAAFGAILLLADALSITGVQ